MRELGLKLLVCTQHEENYAFFEGGERWKCKGGEDYYIDLDDDVTEESIQAAIAIVATEFINNDGFREYMIDYKVLDRTGQAEHIQSIKDFYENDYEMFLPTQVDPPVADLTNEQVEQWQSESDYANQFQE